MERIIVYTAAGLIALHGVIHLLGFAAYWPLAEIAELPYKTSLFNGRWELGESGMRSFSTLWLIVAAGLVGSAAGLALKQAWWLPLMSAAVLLSLIICVLDWQNAWRGAIISLVALIPLLLVWGLRVQPQPFAAYPEAAKLQTTVPLPADLPDPVARYYQTIIGDEIPVVDSAVISARGTTRFAGVTLPARLRFTHNAGQGYRHYIESTFFGYPLLKVNEHFLEGQARLQLPGNIVENEPKVDQAANLALWGESIWLPTIWITDPRVRWEPISERSARLIIPFDDSEDTFTVTFDPETGLPTRLEAMRYRDAADVSKILWQLDILAWDDYNGLRIPSRSSATWADEGTPWLMMEIEQVVYNADVTEYVRDVGP